MCQRRFIVPADAGRFLWRMSVARSSSFDPARFSALRAFLRWSGRRSLRWFYRETAVVQVGTVPATGPVLFIGNHPNDLPDILLGLQACPRHVRYLATISAGAGGASARGYAAMGVIPVTRVRDARKMRAMGIDMAAVNAEAGRRVSQAMADGHVVGVFPQGGVHDVPQIGRLRTGIAMMVLNALDTGAVFDVTVVPFGNQYESPLTLGSDALAVVGRGWSVRGWRDAQVADGGDAGVSALTEQLRASLVSVTRNAPDWESSAERDELVAAVAAVLPPSRASLLERAARLVPLAEQRVRDRRSDAPTPHAARLHTFVTELAQLVHDAGGVRTSARDHARLLHAVGVAADAALAPRALLLLQTPVALLGWAIHLPIFLAVRRVARRMAKARTDVVAYTFVPGLQVVGAGYLLLGLTALAVLAVLGRATLGTLSALLAVLLLLPALADVAVSWRNGWRGHALVWRVRRWPASRRAEVRRVAEAMRGEWHNGSATGAPSAGSD